MTAETTELARTFVDDLDQLPADLPSVQIDPGRLNWYHGVDAGKVKTPGVFFGRETAFTEVPPPAPWEADDRFIEEDGPGFSVARLRIAIIGSRDQWFIPGETKKDKVQWLVNGQRAPAGTKVKHQIEYLVLVDGLSDPMVLSVSGYYKSKSMENIVRAYERGALAQLMRQKRRTFPRWSHWLTIGGKTDSRGQPLYEEARDAVGDEKGSVVTPPALLAPPMLLSKEAFQAGIDAWMLFNALGWFKFKRTPQGVTEAVYAIEEHPALPPGRNAPQALSNDDLPDPFA